MANITANTEHSVRPLRVRLCEKLNRLINWNAVYYHAASCNGASAATLRSNSFEYASTMPIAFWMTSAACMLVASPLIAFTAYCSVADCASSIACCKLQVYRYQLAARLIAHHWFSISARGLPRERVLRQCLRVTWSRSHFLTSSRLTGETELLRNVAACLHTLTKMSSITGYLHYRKYTIITKFFTSGCWMNAQKTWPLNYIITLDVHLIT